jgi:hypothetical protein
MPTNKKPGQKKKKGGVPSVTVDEELEARWEREITRFRHARASELASWDERYEALGNILEGELYLAGHFRSASAFLSVEAPDLDERTAKQYARVARCFDPEDEAAHGVAKLDALLEYLEAQGDGQLAKAKVMIKLATQKVSVPDGKKSIEVPFAEVTREALRRATRALKGKSGKVAPKLPPLVSAIKEVATSAGVPTIGVRLAGGRVDLTGIPTTKLQALCRALGKAKLPIAE